MNIKVILQEKIAKLGNIGDQVSVRPGYARNFLLRYGKAVPATVESIAEFEKLRASLVETAAKILEKAKSRAEQLKAKVFKIAAKASEEGRLFGSVGPREIAEAISAAGIAVEKREINLPSGPIRQTGEYDIMLHLHTDVALAIKVEVVAE